MTELYQYYGGDIALSATGDLLLADDTEASKQRVLRRLLTNQGDYLWQPDYGAGLPSYIGAVLDQAEITSLIRSQMYLEGSVSHDPQPNVDIQEIPNGISAQIVYNTADEETTLSFSLSP